MGAWGIILESSQRERQRNGSWTRRTRSAMRSPRSRGSPGERCSRGSISRRTGVLCCGIRPRRCSSLTRRGVNLAAPVFGHSDVNPVEADLTIQGGGEPIGERITVRGRLLDGWPSGARQLVEIWQANAAGRYIHQRDQHRAPTDPHFTGAGRCLTGTTAATLSPRQARPLPMAQPPQRLAPGTHPLLAVRNRLHAATDHPDVLPG